MAESEPIPLNYDAPPPGVPTALAVVAWLFIAGGVLSILQIIFDLFNSRISINLGVLGVFIGPGLLRFRPGWRTCALVMLWISMLSMIFVGLMLLLTGPSVMPVNFFGVTVGSILRAVVFIFDLLLFLPVLWSYRVLVRPEIRELFGLQPSY